VVQDREQGTCAIAMGVERGIDRGPMCGLQQGHGLGIRLGVPAAFALACFHARSCRRAYVLQHIAAGGDPGAE
jgi:hypothetical protein